VASWAQRGDPQFEEGLGMRKHRIVPGLLLAVFVLVVVAAGAGSAPEWSFNATIIEACSCPMFCQCYFNSQPAEHHGHGGAEGHFCKFNNAFKVNKGRHGDTKLDGVKFWVAGDLGGDFSKGKMDWAVLTFDPATTAEQRAGVQAVLGQLYPVQWNSFTIAEDAAMEWKGGKDRAEARLAGGQAAEVVLVRQQGMTGEPVVIKNLKYWGAARNDGFVLMPNEVEAYRVGDKAFEYKGTNGFMITVDLTSKDAG
jgi:hypothetical protein